MRHPYFDVPVPVVIGHRGAAGEAPENTLPSFERALADGAAILESDVHLSRDGAVVLIHDDVLERTTDGSGRVAAHSLAELQRLDAGYRFSPDGGRSFPWRDRGVRIPTLEQAFAALPGARFNLELKEGGAACAERVVEHVLAAGREDLTLLTAAEDDQMAELREVLGRTGAGVAVGACGGDVLRFVRSALEGEAPPPEPMALQVPDRFAGRPVVTAELVRHAHAHEIAVHVWTVNEVADMERLLDLGVDGLVTDYPGRMAALLAERRRRAEPRA